MSSLNRFVKPADWGEQYHMLAKRCDELASLEDFARAELRALQPRTAAERRYAAHLRRQIDYVERTLTDIVSVFEMLSQTLDGTAPKTDIPTV